MASIKAKLMQQFPEGEFTAFLNDPLYFEKREARNKKMEALYQQSYTSYLFNDFDAPIANLAQAKDTDKDSELMPKFKFLAGLSYAKTGQQLQFEKELKDITKEYPKNEITPLAEEMLRLYAEGRTPVTGPASSNLIAQRTKGFAREQRELGNTIAKDETASSFTVDHKAQHALIVLANPDADLNRLRFNMADYNFSKFLLNDYEIGQAQLPDGTPLLSVSGFRNRLEALDYFYSLRERTDIFKIDNLEYRQMYVINNKNMEYLLSSGDKERYDTFFAQNYLAADAFKKEEEEPKNEQIEAAQIKKQEAPIEQVKTQAPQTEKTSEIKKAITATQSTAAKEVVTAVAEEVLGKKPELKKEEETPGQENTISPATEAIETPTVEEPKMEIPIIETPVVEKPVSVFTVQEGRHNAIIVFKKGSIDTKRIGMIFTNYTKSNYGTKYEVEHKALEDNYYCVMVKGFANANEAEDYLKKVKLDSYIMREVSRAENYLWPITNDNFLHLTGKESIDSYQEFYKSNY